MIGDLLRSLEQLLFGIDGGGTKTEFMVLSHKGIVLKQFIMDGCNPNDIRKDNAVAVINYGIK